MHFKSDIHLFMKAGCLTKSLLKIDAEEGSYVRSRGVAKCTWYNDKRLWSSGYNISGSELNLWINSCSILAAGKRAYSSQNTNNCMLVHFRLTFFFVLIKVGVIVISKTSVKTVSSIETEVVDEPFPLPPQDG